MNFYCFYHNDMDGKASAWCVHNFIMNRLGKKDSPTRYQKHGYGDMWKFDSINKDTIAFVVDLSFTSTTRHHLKAICDRAKYVIWIDHHQSSIDFLNGKYGDWVKSIPNLFTFVHNEACGALLTYAWTNAFGRLIHQPLFESMYGGGNKYRVEYKGKEIFGDNRLFVHCIDDQFAPMNISVPYWLALVDDYDRWQGNYEDTNSFILGCDLGNTAIAFKNEFGEVVFNNEFWQPFFIRGDVVFNFIDKGSVVFQYINSRYKRELVYTFEYTLEDGTVILCKNGSGNSWNFQDKIREYPAVCLFYFNGKTGQWNHSIYSDEKSDFDCAKFCEKFGGGGHKHAAGFQTPSPVFVEGFKF